MKKELGMIKRVLIANRGEIAIRIIRALREMGLESVAIFSEPDRDSLHVKLADDAICIGPAKASDSYLSMSQVLSACILKRCDAIHPGFGFLSENAKFAKICEDCNVCFIGPKSELISHMGDKKAARATAIEAGVPVVPGYSGDDDSLETMIKQAERIGFPIMMKAASGGGGRGIRIVNDIKELESMYYSVKKEAKSAFDDDRVYLEKYIKNPKHIEVQILGDMYGNIVHLGERECSMQRKNQKLIEEAPSASISQELRNKITKSATDLAEYTGYYSLGTVEFLVDSDENYYFMEMNTRIQVEHPVTEMVTGRDLVKDQIRIAMGEEIGYTQDDVEFTGHSIECRINAEDPKKDFTPSPGTIENLLLPGGKGVRIDSSAYVGGKILPFYDSMIAKIIAHDVDRKGAINKMKSALFELEVGGVKTTKDFQRELISQESFADASYDTTFVEKFIES